MINNIFRVLKEIYSNFVEGLFVCVEVLQHRQPNGAMLSTVSLSNQTFTRQA